MRVPFVCVGNICRSPMAEGMLRHILEAPKVADKFVLDSAGISDAHVGWPPHPKAQSAMRARGIDISTLRARKVTQEDIPAFDFVIALDAATQRSLQIIAGETNSSKIALLLDYTEDWDERSVPDPLLTGASFDVVTNMIEDACFDLFYELERIHPALANR